MRKGYLVRVETKIGVGNDPARTEMLYIVLANDPDEARTAVKRIIQPQWNIWAVEENALTEHEIDQRQLIPGRAQEY
jgi:hypothetical protein